MRKDVQAAITVSGERKAGLNVVEGHVREIVQHLGNGHTAPKIIKNVGYSNARAADAWLTAADARVDGDALAVVHVGSVVFPSIHVKVHPDLAKIGAG